ncbi:MAG TPA: hypothetical protein PLB55_13120, partial [Prosthecobacter sp.]|nr:hypothetical protein [Prosthecobacter sp.]
AGIRKLLAFDLARGFAHAAQNAIHSEEIAFREMRGHAGEEGAVAAAEVDFQRTRGIGEDLGVSEFAEVVGGREEGWHCAWSADESALCQVKFCAAGGKFGSLSGTSGCL